jgi:hypothetical protein
MGEKIINMKDMMSLYEITDQFSIDRELIEVPLEKDGGGAVNILDNSRLQIIVPLNTPVDRWLITLEKTLIQLGFSAAKEENEWTK